MILIFGFEPTDYFYFFLNPQIIFKSNAHQTMLHWELNLKAVSFLSLDCLMAVNTYCFCVLSVEYQQNFLFYLACTDMKSNGLALRFHRSQLVRNKLLHLRHRHVCGGSLKYPEIQIFSSLWLNLCSCQLLGCDPQH